MMMPLPANRAPREAFLGVARSVCGRAWRDRLDERATARALSMTQRHGVSELLGRILAGREVEVDGVEEFLDPTVKRLMPDPHVLTAMKDAASRTPGKRMADVLSPSGRRIPFECRTGMAVTF